MHIKLWEVCLSLFFLKEEVMSEPLFRENYKREICELVSGLIGLTNICWKAAVHGSCARHGG